MEWKGKTKRAPQTNQCLIVPCGRRQCLRACSWSQRVCVPAHSLSRRRRTRTRTAFLTTTTACKSKENDGMVVVASPLHTAPLRMCRMHRCERLCISDWYWGRRRRRRHAFGCGHGSGRSAALCGKGADPLVARAVAVHRKDNCPRVKNTDQANADNDKYGDLCDLSGTWPTREAGPRAGGTIVHVNFPLHDLADVDNCPCRLPRGLRRRLLTPPRHHGLHHAVLCRQVLEL